MRRDDATLLLLCAEALRSRVMSDRAADTFADALDRIAGVGGGVDALRRAVAGRRYQMQNCYRLTESEDP